MFALFHSDVIIDREALRRWLPPAMGLALVETHGGKADRWQAAYRQVQADWDSYWADLTLDNDDSLAQWREGNFRVVRAVFRLARMAMPAADRMDWYVDDLPLVVGRHCPALKDGLAEIVQTLHESGIAAGVIAPTLSSGLVRGMLEAAGLEKCVQSVIGPDEIGQVGLDGITGSWLAELADVSASDICLISPISIPGLMTIALPATPSSISEQILNREQ
jgi:hypothetical protein